MDTIYLQINIKASKAKIKQHVDAYNEKIMRQNPDDYHKYTIKGGHLTTAYHILIAYYNHLINQAKYKSQSPRPLIMNNKAIAEMMGATTTGRTAANHIARLMAAEIVIKKEFRGTNTGFFIEMNPDLLVAMPDTTLINNVTALYEQCVLKGHPDSPEERQKIQFLTPSFSTFSGGIGKLFRHIVTRTLLELNFNMQGGIVDNHESTPQAPQDSQVNNDGIAPLRDGNELERELEHGLLSDGKTSDSTVTGEIEENSGKKVFRAPKISIDEVARREKIGNFAILAWNFIQTNLYNGREFAGHDVIIALDFLKKHFTGHSANSNTLAEAFNKLVFRVILTRQYVLREPGRYVPHPRKWLDPTFQHGFHGTAGWLDAVTTKQKENAEYYSNLKLVSELYRQFAANPGAFNFIEARQTLGKKKNKEYLEMFDKAVLAHPAIKDIYQKMTSHGIS